MICKDAQNLINGYVDGELDLIRNLEIERHIQDCALCTQDYKNHQVLSNAIKTGSLYFKAPADLRRRIQLSLRKAAKAEAGRRMLPKWWFNIAAPMAAAAVILLALVPFLRGPSADDLLAGEVISSHVRSLMVSHLADVSSSDQHTVKPWFAGKLNFSPPVEDLAKQGFPLIGGRLDYLEDRPVAALIYQRQKHFINLFIWPSGSDSDVETKTVLRQGYNLSHWTRSGMTFWAVSDLNNTELQKFVQLVQNQTSSSTAMQVR
jgi:anti-sigma factor RsiW